MPALQLRQEKSQSKTKPYSLARPSLRNSPAAATWSVPPDLAPGTGPPANLPPEGCFSLLTWSLFPRPPRFVWFFHVFKFGQMEKKNSLQLIQVIMLCERERENLNLSLAALLTAINCPPTHVERVEPEFP